MHIAMMICLFIDLVLHSIFVTVFSFIEITFGSGYYGCIILSTVDLYFLLACDTLGSFATGFFTLFYDYIYLFKSYIWFIDALHPPILHPATTTGRPEDLFP